MGSTIFWILVIIVLVFGAYAWWTQYGAQPADKSKAAKMWGSLVAAAAALGALIMGLFQSP